eukprot:scaffold137_cov398-Prasinococcus_capsulatus_cf.AAC.40
MSLVQPTQCAPASRYRPVASPSTPALLSPHAGDAPSPAEAPHDEHRLPRACRARLSDWPAGRACARMDGWMEGGLAGCAAEANEWPTAGGARGRRKRRRGDSIPGFDLRQSAGPGPGRNGFRMGNLSTDGPVRGIAA